MKKFIIPYMLVMALGIIISSCGKEDTPVQQVASLTIVNAIAGSTPLVTNFYNDAKLEYYRTAQAIAAYNSVKYGGYLGSYNLGIYRLADTTKIQYQTQLQLEPNTIKTLYLAGTIAQTDGCLVVEDIPVTKQIDSVFNIRFVNLSKGTGLVNVTIRNPQKTMTSNLDYKGITKFQTISAKAMDLPQTAPLNYIFDFQDANTGATIASYTLTTAVMQTLLAKSITVVLRGIRGETGTSAPGTFIINNY